MLESQNSAETLRITITQHFHGVAGADHGHLHAVTWIDQNIFNPAHAMLVRYNIAYNPNWINSGH